MIVPADPCAGKDGQSIRPTKEVRETLGTHDADTRGRLDAQAEARIREALPCESHSVPSTASCVCLQVKCQPFDALDVVIADCIKDVIQPLVSPASNSSSVTPPSPSHIFFATLTQRGGLRVSPDI